MTRKFEIVYRKRRKVLGLLAVYFMHMVLFQALMASHICHGGNSAGTFKPLFYHTNQVPPTHLPNHPAVSYYTMLVKQGNYGLRSCIAVSVEYSALNNFFDVNRSMLTERRYHVIPNSLVHLGDDNFKLYCNLHSFLI